MTPLRHSVLTCISTHRDRGNLVSLSRIARECGLTDYRNARRVVDDLRDMGII